MISNQNTLSTRLLRNIGIFQMIVSLLALLWGAAACAATEKENAPAAGPFFRTLAPPKVAYITDKPLSSEQVVERWRHDTNADITFVPFMLAVGEIDLFHFFDKPLEPGAERAQAVLQLEEEHLKNVLTHLGDFDVVVADIGTAQNGADPKDATVRLRLLTEQKLADYARTGGNLVFIGSGYRNTPLEPLMPVKDSDHPQWTQGDEGSSDHPLTRGLPFEIVGFHSYTTLEMPQDESSIALLKNSNAINNFWYRRVPGAGQVVQLFSDPTTSYLWRFGTSYDKYGGDRPDDSAVWAEFVQRLFYWLTYGDKAFPVLSKIALPDKTEAHYGQKLSIPVEVETRSDTARTVTVVLNAGVRRAKQFTSLSRSVTLQKGERQSVVFDVPMDVPCADPYLKLRARVLEGAAVLSESTSWLPFVHQAPVTVQIEKPAYAPGQRFRANVQWDKDATPGSYAAQAFLVDRQGRALASTSGQVVIAPNTPGVWTPQFTMPDGGPEMVSSYWVTAVLRTGEHIAGTARAQVQVDEPWDMRRQMQWSVWWSGQTDGGALSLLRDAGFNALGFQGSSHAADKYGLHQYVEGAGNINTFGVKIEHDNWDAVRAEMEAQLNHHVQEYGVDARSKSLISLGEESGFGGGWGQTFYWEGDKAPPIPQKIFDEFLSDRYNGKIADLNAEWGANYQTFSEIPLERSKSNGISSQLFIGAQNWAALDAEKKKSVFPVELIAPDAQQQYLAHTAPYYETRLFYTWYYQKYCDLATQVYRQKRNAVPLTIMSAPGGFYPKVDVPNLNGMGAFYPKEASQVGNAIQRRDYGDVPGFSGAMWTYFDLRPLWETTVLSPLVSGNTHLDYWVGFPLSFNPDLTHTRASFWTKVLTTQLHPVNPVLLHKRVRPTDGLAMFVGEQPLYMGVVNEQFNSATSPNGPIYSALEESGYLPRVTQASQLKDTKVLVASHAQVVSAEEGKQIGDWVKNGGTLISTPWLASCSPHGNLLSVYPSPQSGLADVFGFKLLNTSQKKNKEDVAVDANDSLRLAAPLTLTSLGRDKVLDIAPDVQVLAKYKDGTPLLLTRKVGKGKVVYLNLIYDWSNWWNSFHEPSREAFRKLVDGIVRADGRVTREYFLAFENAEATDVDNGWWGMVMKTKPEPGESIPWWASQMYSDPSGQIKYLGVFADHRSPIITARLKLAEPKARIFDLFTGKEIPVTGDGAQMTLTPGGAALWALVSSPPKGIEFHATPRVVAGQPIKATLRLTGLSTPAPVYGAVVDVFAPSGERLSTLSLQNVQITNGVAQLTIPTALNDTPGTYRLVATESITRHQAQQNVVISAAPNAPDKLLLTPFPPRAEDTLAPFVMTSAQFLDQLRRLRGIYDGTDSGLDAKYMLSYFLDVPFRPQNRHAIMRRLQRTDWTPHYDAFLAALRGGEKFYLLGEDLNVDPQTGMKIDPLAASDPSAFIARLAKEKDAKQRSFTSEGMKFDVIEIGKGALITGNASVDRTAFLSDDFIKWHERLKKALAEYSRAQP